MYTYFKREQNNAYMYMCTKSKLKRGHTCNTYLIKGRVENAVPFAKMLRV